MTVSTQDPLQRAIQQAQMYWVSDGVPLIVMGGFWMVWGTVLLLPFLVPSPTLVRLMSMIVVFAMLLMAILMKPLIHRWKERVTFPRTGYIELRQQSKSVRYTVPFVAGVIAFIIGLLGWFGGRSFREWFPLGLGLVLAAGMLHASWKMRSLRLALFSTAVAAAGVVCFLLRLAENLSFALTMLVSGTALVVDGLLTLRSYLHAHPTPAGDE